MTIGERLYRIRTYAKVSQTSLAEASGVSQMRISRIERGLTEPTLKEVIAIATAFDLLPNIEILTGEEDMDLKAHGDLTSHSDAVVRQLRSDIDRLQHVEALLTKSVSDHKLAPTTVQRRTRRTRMSVEDLRAHRQRLAAANRAKKQIGKGKSKVRTRAMKKHMQDQAKKTKV